MVKNGVVLTIAQMEFLLQQFSQVEISVNVVLKFQIVSYILLKLGIKCTNQTSCEVCGLYRQRQITETNGDYICISGGACNSTFGVKDENYNECIKCIENCKFHIFIY